MPFRVLTTIANCCWWSDELTAKEVSFKRPITKFFARIRNACIFVQPVPVYLLVVAEAYLVACPRSWPLKKLTHPCVLHAALNKWWLQLHYKSSSIWFDEEFCHEKDFESTEGGEVKRHTYHFPILYYWHTNTLVKKVNYVEVFLKVTTKLRKKRNEKTRDHTCWAIPLPGQKMHERRLSHTKPPHPQLALPSCMPHSTLLSLLLPDPENRRTVHYHTHKRIFWSGWIGNIGTSLWVICRLSIIFLG